MKNFNSKIKLGILLILISCPNFGFSQSDFNPNISNSNSTAVGYSTYGSSNGVDTFKTLRYTIPFYQNTFSNQITFSHYGGSYSCSNPTKRLQIGNTPIYTPSNILNYTLNVNCPNQATYVFFDLRFLCLTNEAPGGIYSVIRIQKIRIEIIKEAVPSLNLTLSRYCATNPHTGLFNGYMNVQASGSYTNASYLFLRTTNNANSCSFNNDYNVANLGNGNPNYTVTNSTFYSCNSSTTYTVKLFYKRTTIGTNATQIVYEIPNGSYGWNNYSYTKTIKNCLNPIVLDPDKNRLQLSPNPVKDILSLQLENNEKIVSLKIYDYSGAQVKTQVSNKEAETVDLQDIKKGLYFIEIETENGIIRDKIIKE